MNVETKRFSPDGVSITQSDLVRMTSGQFHDAVRIKHFQGGEPAEGTVFGLRQYLSESEGSGFWDVIDAGSMVVCVTDAVYNRNHLLPIEGEQVLKLRVVLEGELLTESGEARTRGPRGEVVMLGDFSSSPYLIGAQHRLRMVLLQCPFAEINRIMPRETATAPSTTDWLISQLRIGKVSDFALTPDMAHAARRIFESRYDLPSGLRHTFIVALATDLLCTVLGDLARRDLNRRSSTLSARDIARIIEARDFLNSHIADPPKISALARLVGINQTKLKLGFKEVIGETIYGFVLRRRMETAADLLLNGEASIAEVAYRVGYEFPANFTSAFKRHFGSLPRKWRMRSVPIPPDSRIMPHGN